MGWTFQAKPRSVRDELTRLLTWETDTVRVRPLDLAIKLSVAYAAVETVQKDSGHAEVWCAVILMRYSKVKDDRFPWGHKDLEESMGPYECDCPERILNLLTPTNNETARQWRLQCRERLNRPGMPAAGTRVQFDVPIEFKNGAMLREFIVEACGRRRRLRGTDGALYRIPRTFWKTRTWKPLVDAGHSAPVESPRSIQMGLL